MKKGDVDNYAIIVKKYQQALFVYCYHLLLQREEAEDAVQDVFIKAFEKIHSYAYGQSFTAWLYKIAYNHCINLLRQRKKKQLRLLKWFVLQKADVTVESLGGAPTGEDPVDPALYRSLLRLSSVERTLIVLRIIEEKSYEEIGAVLNRNPAALRKKFERAKVKLRTIWTELEGEENGAARRIPKLAEQAFAEK